jgi:hypothetical protein
VNVKEVASLVKNWELWELSGSSLGARRSCAYSYCKWDIEATMVWRTPANKTPRFFSVIVVSWCVQTNCPCHVKSMGIVPMHEWKAPLKYRGMLPFPSGPLGPGQAADIMVCGVGGYYL